MLTSRDRATAAVATAVATAVTAAAAVAAAARRRAWSGPVGPGRYRGPRVLGDRDAEVPPGEGQGQG